MSGNQGPTSTRRRRLPIAVTLIVGLLVAMLVSVGAAPPSNPFVGSWDGVDNWNGAGFPDGSHSHMSISGSGRVQFRDDGGSICVNNLLGFVPASFIGSGEFNGDEFATTGDLFCFPDDGGRQLVAEDCAVDFHYDELTDTLTSTGTCWWRSGVGTPVASEDCHWDS